MMSKFNAKPCDVLLSVNITLYVLICIGYQEDKMKNALVVKPIHICGPYQALFFEHTSDWLFFFFFFFDFCFF